ncbi:response regulator [Cohnella yongneupensis]|uniref:Response regulator n=1 Tax=Cohnella yongneupensis TaxID=425006 RepID=A0ABW0R0G4_9BACL
MKVIVVDDEPAMHLIMRKMLTKLPGVELVGTFADTRAADGFLSENPDVQLAFVDVSMPEEGGLKFAARKESTDEPLQIVLVTSHKEFAVDAYDLSVLDYLLKPVSQERLERAVNRALAGRRSLQARASDRDADKPAVTALGDIVVRNGSVRVKWMSRKSGELFAYLLLNRGHRIPRSRLVAEIFAGMSSGSAETYLNTAVYQLRKSLEPLGLREAVRSENDGYALELADASVDYVSFENCVNKYQEIGESDLDAALQTERLFTGDLFGDKAYVWAIHETGRLAGLYSSFVKRLVEALLANADVAGAESLLAKLYARDPLDEDVVRLSMRTHATARDKKTLTAKYTDYVRLLGRELGIKPSQELVLFYDELLTGLSDKK